MLCALLACLALASCQKSGMSGAIVETRLEPPDPDPPPGQASQVRINEVMVQNTATLADEGGAYPPWLELYNPTDSPVELSGVAFSDEVRAAGKWRFPAGPAAVLAPRGYLVIFCDGRSSAGSPLHAPLTLRPGPVELVLNNGSDVFLADGSALRADQSMGRSPDGNSRIWVLDAPTPGAANASPVPRPAGTRGDVNQDGRLNLADAMDLLDYLFLGGFTPYCEPVADANGDGVVNIGDPTAILEFLFLGGTALPALSAEELLECGRNGPPVLPPRPVYHAYPGHAVELMIEAADPEEDRLIYQAIDLPEGASLDGEGRLRWTPGEGHRGPVYLSFVVSDEAVPPHRVTGRLVFQVHPLHGCVRPRCDPARGCEPDLLPLGEECCGGPEAGLPDPEADCPAAAALHVGRNPVASPSVGRMGNCDLLQLVPLGQGGHVARLNLEARCLVPRQVLVEARLEVPGTVLFDESVVLDFEPRAGGWSQRRNLRFVAEGFFVTDMEARLSIAATDSAGLRLERNLRVALTREPVPDLP